MYLKPRTKLRLHFNHSLDDYSDIEDVYFPNEGHRIKRSPMRRRYNKEGQNPWTEWYSDLGHGCEDWHTAHTMIEGFIHKNVGNKFDDVFHRFMNKAISRREFHCYRWDSPKSMFLGYFENEEHRRRHGDYYVDNDGIIRQVPERPRKPKDITIYKKNPPVWSDRYIYTIKADALLSISEPFIILFGRGLYDEILAKRVFSEYELNRLHSRMLRCCSEEVFEEAFSRVKRYREFRHYSYCGRKWINFLFTRKYDNIERVIRFGTREYYKYLKEKKRAEALALKEKRHPDRTHFDDTLKLRKLRHNVRKREEWFRRKNKDISEGEM